MDELRAGPSNVPSIPPVTSAASGSASSDDSTEPMTAGSLFQKLVNSKSVSISNLQKSTMNVFIRFTNDLILAIKINLN